jgi:microtubule-associated protein-like 6
MTNVLGSLRAMSKQPPPNIADIESKTDEFFRKADTDADKKITLAEFKAYVTKDKMILEALLNANVASREELGTDFGSGEGGVPDIEPDLENECCPKELQKPIRKQNIKEGNDLQHKDDGVSFEEDVVGEGDQFMAVKPWVGVTKNTVPSGYKQNKRDTEAPEGSLELEYIHGYRCHDARNNLRYTREGKIVYHAAAVGIVLDQKTNTQKFMNQHNDDLHCLAIDPTGQFCATGQIGAKPQIIVWNNSTMEVVARLQGTLTKGIKNLAFSPDGNLLAASAFDDDHSIAVYQWKATTGLKPGMTLKPISTGKGTRAQILSLGFSPDSKTLIGTAVKEIDFFSFDTVTIKARKGTGLTGTNVQSILCQSFLGQTLYTGMFDGQIASWNGTAVKGFMKAHSEGCHAMSPRPQGKGLLTGGGDGLIILWAASPAGLSEEKRIDLKAPEIRSMMPKVRSVVENERGFVLVGTRGGEIVEFNNGPKPLVYMRSHYEGELWGLATHPSREEFITVGQDNFMAIWDIKQRKQKNFGKLEQAANVAEYSRDGNLLAIGYVNGGVHVLDLAAKFAMKANKKDRKEAISEIKFSPGDRIMAVGAHDSCIITYDVAAGFKPMKRIRGHTSTVTHFDFSLDGAYLMSNCTSYNILFFDAVSGKHITHCSQFRDEPWSSWTCTLGWPVQGIWPPAANGTDINSVDRSPEGLCLATADDFGHVKLFRYPCPVEKVTASHQYNGHSSHVTNVRFVRGTGRYLISTGGNDKCIFQWKFAANKAAAEQALEAANHQVDVSSIADDFDEEEEEEPPKKRQPKGGAGAMDEMFGEEDLGEGDQALAVKAFLGEVKSSTPAQYKNKPIPPTMSEKPSGNLNIKYAHGFRSFDTRNNLKYIND